MNTREIRDKLIGIYFMKCYYGFGAVTKEEDDYLKDNVFKVKITDATKNNGYSAAKILDTLELNKEYTLDRMSVGQSYSDLVLEEFPELTFNTVNFEYSMEKRKRNFIAELELEPHYITYFNRISSDPELCEVDVELIAQAVVDTFTFDDAKDVVKLLYEGDFDNIDDALNFVTGPSTITTTDEESG